ncbi:hypothetical protein BV898_13065 [Hypsibius exemplaris]|uniref:Uncharacterized protein n=1 Tax=Hypsibius exemplaris TaxID=2072580 RepID=A0A1W0WBR2_HYPEX|nr:hypothetical protein BV898_13065 [Hypsibius exemplaris]
MSSAENSTGRSSQNESLAPFTFGYRDASSNGTRLELCEIKQLVEKLRNKKVETKEKLQKFANELTIGKNQSAMKREKRDYHSIKAGLLKMCSENDPVYGLLSKQGLRNSAIARKQLDEEI